MNKPFLLRLRTGVIGSSSVLSALSPAILADLPKVGKSSLIWPLLRRRKSPPGLRMAGWLGVSCTLRAAAAARWCWLCMQGEADGVESRPSDCFDGESSSSTSFWASFCAPANFAGEESGESSSMGEVTSVDSPLLRRFLDSLRSLGRMLAEGLQGVPGIVLVLCMRLWLGRMAECDRSKLVDASAEVKEKLDMSRATPLSRG